MALPSPLVSPPTVSSRHDVSVTGSAVVPVAFKVPLHASVAAAVRLALHDRAGAERQRHPRRDGQRVAAAVEDREQRAAPRQRRADGHGVVVSWTPSSPLPQPEFPLSSAHVDDALVIDHGHAGDFVDVFPVTVGTPTGESTPIPSPVASG